MRSTRFLGRERNPGCRSGPSAALRQSKLPWSLAPGRQSLLQDLHPVGGSPTERSCRLGHLEPRLKTLDCHIQVAGRGRASSQAHQAGQLHPRREGSSWEPPAPACFFPDRLNTALGELGPGSSLESGRPGRWGPLESQQRLPPAYKGRDGPTAPAEAWAPQLGPPCLPRSLKPSRW